MDITITAQAFGFSVLIWFMGWGASKAIQTFDYFLNG